MVYPAPPEGNRMTRIDTHLLAKQLAHASREAFRLCHGREGDERLSMLRAATNLGHAAQAIDLSHRIIEI